MFRAIFGAELLFLKMELLSRTVAPQLLDQLNSDKEGRHARLLFKLN